MKTLGFIAASCLVIGLSGSANAETFTAVEDPSGAAMCVDATGHVAALSSCETPNFDKYVSQEDPSGVDVCFTKEGAKAPLAECEAQLSASVVVPDAKAGSFLALLNFFF